MFVAYLAVILMSRAFVSRISFLFLLVLSKNGIFSSAVQGKPRGTSAQWLFALCRILTVLH